MTYRLKKMWMLGALFAIWFLCDVTVSQAVPTIAFTNSVNGFVYKGPKVDPGLSIEAAIDAILGIDDPSRIQEEWFTNDLRVSLSASFVSIETSVDDIITATFTGEGRIILGFLAGFGELGKDELILEGVFDSLTVAGASEADAATVRADLRLLDGLLIDVFGADAILEGEISVGKFSDNLFQGLFEGGLKGTISALPQPVASPVPEPATLILFGLGIICLVTLRKKS